jgi:7-cyano-7-deazaguanine synthase
MKSPARKQKPGRTKKRAVVLLSGGMDSAVCAAMARKDGFELYALTLDYGQVHRREIQCAKKIARGLNLKKHLVLKVDLRQVGRSALLGQGRVPKGRSAKAIGIGIPPTYVPARNTVFLSLALAWAEALCAKAIFIGVNARDFSGYPDCRPDYIQAFEDMARLATKAGRERKGPIIKTPLLRMTKAEIIQKGMKLGMDFSLTLSCYDPGPGGTPCGRCDACILRKKAFREAGLTDPSIKQGQKRQQPKK